MSRPARASNLKQVRICPGSMQAQEGLPEPAKEEWTESGSRIHQATGVELLGTAIVEDMIPEEREQVDWLKGQVLALLTEHDGLRDSDLWVEESLVWKDAAGRDKLTGHPDFMAVAVDGTGHIFDAKTGWLSVDLAEHNDQLEGYIVMAAGNSLSECAEIYVHVLAFRGRPQVSSYCYDQQAMEAAIADIASVAWNGRRKNAIRRPDPDACRYCRALGNPERCPESCSVIPAITAVAESGPAELSQADATRMMDLLDLADKFKKKFKPWFKEQLAADPEFSPNWKLIPGGVRKSVPADRTPDACGLLADVLTVPEFMNCTTMMLPAAGKILAKMQDISQVQGKKMLEDILGDLIQSKEQAQKLVRA